MGAVSSVLAHPAPQGSPAWHALRRLRYGASETPQIAGLGGSARRIWRAKLSAPEALDPKVALSMELGHLLEPWALELWARATGRTVQQGPVLYEERGWLAASLDGASDGEPVEAKVVTLGAPDIDQWGDETVPGAKELQVRQQAMLMERHLGRRIEAAHLTAVFLTGHGVEHRTYRVELTAERREQWADVWAPYPGRWHTAYVLGRVPPPDATAADVAVLVEPTSVTSREATDEELALVAALAAAEAEREAKAAEAAAAVRARDKLRHDLARRLGPDHTIPGLTWKARRNHPPLLTLEKP